MVELKKQYLSIYIVYILLWLSLGLSREYLKKHAIDWYAANEMLKKECPKYGIKYYDTSENRIETLNNIMSEIEKYI